MNSTIKVEITVFDNDHVPNTVPKAVQKQILKGSGFRWCFWENNKLKMISYDLFPTEEACLIDGTAFEARYTAEKTGN